jgi:hypothetical protein
MRSPNVELVHETVALCFDQVLNSLGERTKQTIYTILAKRGIDKNSLSSRFQDVENVLVEFYGWGGRSLLIGTLSKLCEEYSIPLNLSYSDSLNNRMIQLTENIMMQKLVPRHYRQQMETRTFEDTSGVQAPWSD